MNSSGIRSLQVGTLRHRRGRINVSSASLNFGSIVVGQSATESVTLTWTGRYPITVTSDTLSGAGFSLVGVTFPLTLPPQVAITIPLRWIPATVGGATGQLSFASEVTGPSAAVVNLSGTGIAPAVTRLLQLSTTQLSFGAVTVSDHTTQVVTLTSVGTGDLAVSSAMINGVAFRVVGAGVPITLKPMQSTTLQIQFTAAAVGAVSGQLSVNSNATSGAAAVVALSGSGKAAATSQLSANTATLNFGTVAVNTRSTQALTLTSSGTGPVTVTSASTSGKDYLLISGTLPTTLAPHQTTTLQLEFDPTAPGQEAGQLTILSNSAKNSSLVVALSGSGQAVSHSVELMWSPPTSSSDPVTGYNVYRSSGGQPLQKLNAKPQSQSSYTDTAVANGTTYTYEVKSVDAQAVEGAASNSTDVSVP